MAATRFWLPSTGAAAVSPAFDAEWEETGSADRIAAVTTKISSSMAGKSITTGATTANLDSLARQYVSAPIAAGPIAGTLKGQIRTSQSVTSANARAQVIVRLFSNDGSTLRGVLYAGDLETLTNPSSPTSEFATTLTNRMFPRAGAVTLSPLSALTNDRIVIEIGSRKHVATSGQIHGFSFGDNSGTDLPEDESTTATNNPWFEFSDDLFVSRLRGARAYILD